MTKPLFIARQSALPTGLLGGVVARVMTRETADVNEWVERALAPKPAERIIELGCGAGRSIARFVRAVGPEGLVVGIDPSAVMLQQAVRRNRAAIDAGHCEIAPGDARSVPYPDGHFDKWVSVHTVYFWPDLREGLREAARTLRPGGALFLGFHPRENTRVSQALPREVYALPSRDEVECALTLQGCAEVRTRLHAETGFLVTSARMRG